MAEGRSTFAWVFGLGAFLVFVLAGAVYYGYATAAFVGGWSFDDLMVAGVLLVLAGAVIYHREVNG